MNWVRKIVLLGAVAASLSIADAAVANADENIDFGTSQAGCRAAEKQAKALGIRYANCHETGPGHYSLTLVD